MAAHFDAAPARGARRPLAGSELDGVLLAGGSGAEHAAAAVVVLATPHSPVPVVRAGAELPGWVGPRSLVLVLGRPDVPGGWRLTAEQASGRGAAVWRIGSLSAAPHPAGPPQPHQPSSAGVELHLPADDVAQRLSFAPLTAAALTALAGVGLLDARRVASSVRAAADQLTSRLAELAGPSGSGESGAGAAIEALAARLSRTIPLVLASEGIGGVAAWRLQAAVNQSAKSPALAATLPGAITEGLCAFGQLGDVTRQLLVLVELRSDHELAAAAGWFAAARPLLDEVVAATVTVTAAGDGALAQLLDLVLVADAAALLTAGREGIDALALPAAAGVYGGRAPT